MRDACEAHVREHAKPANEVPKCVRSRLHASGSMRCQGLPSRGRREPVLRSLMPFAAAAEAADAVAAGKSAATVAAATTAEHLDYVI